MTETDDGDNGGSIDNDDLGGVLGDVGLEYDDDDGDDDDEADTTEESTETATESGSDSEPVQESDDDPAAQADDGPFAPDPEMQLTESFGTKLTPPEKEFVELYVEFSDEYDNPGAFLREFVRQLRQEHGQEVMRRKEALEELKGGL